MNKREIFKKIHDLVLAHRGLTCVVIIALAFVLAVLMIILKPRAKRKPIPKMQARVFVNEIKPNDYRVKISAMGEVKAKREVKLFPQVAGKVVKISDAFDEGSIVKKGDILLEIEKDDYQMKLDLAEAKYEKELGRQSVAKQEYEFVKTQVAQKQKVDSYLALRGPELKEAKANLETAKLNLARTVIVAPFDALILNKNVDLGQHINAQTMIAEAYSSDVFRIEALIPVSKLKWFEGYVNDENIGKAYVVETEGNDTVKRDANLIRVLDALKTKSHMGRVLLEVNNPLVPTEKNPNPLFLGSFVKADIFGKNLKNVYRIARSNLHHGDVIWFNDDMTLGVRKVNVVYLDKEYVYFRDDSSSIRLITSDIATPIEGLQLNIVGAKNE